MSEDFEDEDIIILDEDGDELMHGEKGDELYRDELDARVTQREKRCGNKISTTSLQQKNLTYPPPPRQQHRQEERTRTPS